MREHQIGKDQQINKQGKKSEPFGKIYYRIKSSAQTKNIQIIE